MNFNFFTSLFKKNDTIPNLSESLLIEKLRTVANENDLGIFENITIYHHAKNFFIPLLVIDKTRGIFIFEYKKWSYDDLKNTKAQRASNQEPSKKTLAFDRLHEFIRLKFKEITHHEGIPIFNYLLMENLNEDEYENLDISFKELIPKNKVIFNNTTSKEILNKIKNSEPLKNKLCDADIMCAVLIQYAIIEDTNTFHLASKEQIKFIDSPLLPYCKLKAPHSSGKTSSVLLKAILEKLKNPQLKIIIIKPTILACDIFKKKLIDSVEHAIVEIDIASIDVLTPKELINRHLLKLNKSILNEEVTIETVLMKKSFDIADLIICDDADFYSEDFLDYLSHIQKKSSLITVENSNTINDELSFTKNFKYTDRLQHYYKANQLVKAMDIISSLLKEHNAKDVLVVGGSLSLEKLKDDLEFFIKDKAVLLDSSKHLVEQNLDTLLLSSYEDTNSLDIKFAILIDICFADIKQLEYAYNLASKSVYIIYQDECKNLSLIRNNFESN